MSAVVASTAQAAQPSSSGGSRLLALAVKFAVAVVVVFALGSPIWVLLHGMGYLNQSPPPYWNINAGQFAPGQHVARAASFGGC